MTVQRRLRDLEKLFEDEFSAFERESAPPEQMTIIELPDNGRGPGGPVSKVTEYGYGNLRLRIYPAGEFLAARRRASRSHTD